MASTSRCKFSVSPSVPSSRQSNDRSASGFDIPYFAHQQLDPNKYSADVNLPVGKPGWAPGFTELGTTTNASCYNDVNMSRTYSLEDDSYFDSPAQQATETLCAQQQKDYPTKRTKIVGGRPPLPKKVTADLDSDDELIVRMKKAKYLEKDIAKRLADEGRTAYNPKTIGTRWARLKRALERREDELLDAELTEWHDGDDEVLYTAIRRADELVARAKADAESKRWRIVADQMQQLKPVVSFSQNACRQRYHNLQVGTARPTPESITNPNEATLKSIQSRCDKERVIAEDLQRRLASIDAHNTTNVEGNAWTSKRRKYF